MKLKFKEIGLTNLLILIVSLVFVGISAAMIFAGEFNLVYLLYGISIVAINLGILMIVQYFTTDAFKNSNAYGFSVGALIVFLSIFIIIRAESIAENSGIILALFLLLSGVVVLQYSMDLHRIKAFISSLILLAGILMIVCSILVVWQPISDKISYDKISWWMVFFAGILSIFCDIFTMIRVKLYNKRALQEEELLGTGAEANTEVPVQNVSTPDYAPVYEDKTLILVQNDAEQNNYQQ